jgi:cellulose synthase/poly-beta-1,6-N-acetylglucosamine synthase-like glycosyltransferase/transposase-like protein
LKILELIILHPEWSSQKISLSLPKIDGRPLVGNHGVQNVLFRLGLNTAEKRKDFAGKVEGLELKEALKVARGEAKVEEKIIRPAFKPKELTPAQRLEMIERAIKYGEPVAKVCRDFEVSRPVFYKWLNRYLAVPEEEREVVLQDKKPKVERYYRQTPEKYEEAILSVVAQYPQFGVARIVEVLPQIAGKPLVGHHGVQNVLRRNNLNTYEQRLAYSQAQVTPVTRLISRFVELGTRFIVLPAPTRVRVIKFASISLSVAFSTIVVLGAIGYFVRVSAAAPPASRIGLVFATIALGIGSIFFVYSMKYYLTLALVLSFSRQPLEEGGGYNIRLNEGINNRKSGNGPPVGGWLQKIFGLKKGPPLPRQGEVTMGEAGGLQPSLDHIKLRRYPFVSIHLPFYNEKEVAERILKACTSMDYPGDCYEVIVCDDSTDETIDIVQKYAEAHKKAQPQGPKLKVIHRPTREGFKGGALKYAVKNMDPRTEFCVVFDADFIPYPDTLELFIKYFKANNNNTENYTKSNIAVVGGYQWHVLNKSENWVTRGVRTEYAGSYVIERPGREILGLLKQISGAVYMIRADVLKRLGWGTSITEDFQLTLRLYEQGYKVIYTPYVQAPAECVSTLTRLIRQRMRWAEGHSNNIRKMFLRLMIGRWEKASGEAGGAGEKERVWVSSPLSLMEKLEVLYISPYYLQAAFFLMGTFSWLLAETVFPARLPFWTSLWGWSLVLTNFFSLPLVNAVGLFLEESEEKDYLGLLSFVALSYILVPFQAYASFKGFIEREEGPWFRTPKTGRITDVFTRGRFYRWIAGILPGRASAPAIATASQSSLAPALVNPYLALTTANNRFDADRVPFLPRKRIGWIGKVTLAIILAISTTIFVSVRNVSLVYAAPDVYYLSDDLADGTGGYPNDTDSWQLQTSAPNESNTACSAVSPGAAPSVRYLKTQAGGIAQFYPIVCSNTAGLADGRGWYSIYQTGQYPSGTWTFNLRVVSDNNATGNWGINVRVKIYDSNGGSFASQFTTSPDRNGTTCDQGGTDDNDSQTYSTTETTINWSCTAPLVDLTTTTKSLYFDVYANANGAPSAHTVITLFTERSGLADGDRSKITTTTFGIPESLRILLLFSPFVPFVAFLLRKRMRGQKGFVYNYE